MLLSIWTDPRIACLEVARPGNQTSCCVEKEFHVGMRELKREISLNPIFLIIITLIIFIHEMYEDMPCMHMILHVGKISENYTCIKNH